MISARGLLAVEVSILVLGASAIAGARPGRAKMARAVDRSYDLQDRVRTALQSATVSTGTGLAALQRDEASELLDEIAFSRALRRRAPRRELLLLAIAAVSFVGLILVTIWPGGPGAGGGNARGDGATGAAGAALMTPAPGAGARSTTSGARATPEQVPGPSPLDQRDLEALAAALRPHALTRSAAELIIATRYTEAAASVRDAGRGANGVDPGERRALAADLRQAATNTMSAAGVLTRDAVGVAAALQQADADATQAAFNQLAADIERAGRGQLRRATPNAGGPASPAIGGTAAAPSTPPAGQTPAAPTAAPLLGTDGRPVQLPAAPGRGTPTGVSGTRAGNGASTPGTTGASSGTVNGTPLTTSGSDSSTIAPDRRDAVERYFGIATPGAP